MILPTNEPTRKVPLYMALELDSVRWHIGFSTAMAQPMRTRSIAPGDVVSLHQEIEHAIKRLCPGAPPSEIVSCYEAGRDGFWLHRLLTEQNHPTSPDAAPIPIRNVIIDAASISVTREARRAKSDSIDRESLMRHLVRWNEGESKVWRVIRVPTREDENARLLEREIQMLTGDRTRERNRISGALRLHGVAFRPKNAAELVKLRAVDGKPLPPELVAMLGRGFDRLDLLATQISALESERSHRMALPTRTAEMSRRLKELKGLGEVGASVLVHELFGWRNFRNRREVGSSSGLCPTPFASGRSHREQGINRAGNRRVRRIAIQLAWIWVRNQPDSTITKWFEQRFAQAGPRGRKVGITAVARKLLVAIWRYLEHGVVPDGARLKAPKEARPATSKPEPTKGKSRRSIHPPEIRPASRDTKPVQARRPSIHSPTTAIA